MSTIAIIVVVGMLIYSWVAAEAEKRGEHTGERSAQGAVSLGWIILIILGLAWLFTRGSTPLTGVVASFADHLSSCMSSRERSVSLATLLV